LKNVVSKPRRSRRINCFTTEGPALKGGEEVDPRGTLAIKFYNQIYLFL